MHISGTISSSSESESLSLPESLRTASTAFFQCKIFYFRESEHPKIQSEKEIVQRFIIAVGLVEWNFESCAANPKRNWVLHM